MQGIMGKQGIKGEKGEKGEQKVYKSSRETWSPKFIKVVWYPKMDQRVRLFKFGAERSIVCYCTQKEKMNYEGFTQNGCYGNQPQPFEALFYSIDANSSCSFTNQDLTVK